MPEHSHARWSCRGAGTREGFVSEVIISGGTDTGGLAWLFSCGIAFVRQARDLPRITTPARRDYGEFCGFRLMVV